jgi:hypothetical protein
VIYIGATMTKKSKKEFVFGEHSFKEHEYSKDVLIYKNKDFKKEKSSDFILTQKKSGLSSILFSKERNEVHVTYFIYLSHLEKLIKNIKKDTRSFKKEDKKKKKKLGAFLRHLGPDLTFVVDYYK